MPVRLAPTKILHSKRVRPMRLFQYRFPDAIFPDHRGQSRQRFVELMRIPERGLEQSKLLRYRPDRFGAERDGNDRMLGLKIFEVRLQHPEKKIDLVGRLRDLE